MSSYGVTRPQCISKFSQRQDSRYFANDIFKSISIAKFVVFWFKWHLRLSPRIQLIQDSTSSDNSLAPHKRHYDDVIMTMLASQITSLTVVYSIVYSGVIQRKHQSSASLAFVREIHRGPVNFPHKWPVTRKMFPFDDVIMRSHYLNQ